mmetsp:Transcript_4614/g.12918  ORF Transcript_4614/g.12918 Transcript_4614/m.12918 type:complete len:136 (+) Transcript_4614:1740-2147(+)
MLILLLRRNPIKLVPLQLLLLLLVLASYSSVLFGNTLGIGAASHKMVGRRPRPLMLALMPLFISVTLHGWELILGVVSSVAVLAWTLGSGVLFLYALSVSDRRMNMRHSAFLERRCGPWAPIQAKWEGLRALPWS